MISLEKWYILTPLQKLPKNVEDLGTLIVAKGFKSCPKSNKSPNLVTLPTVQNQQLSTWAEKSLHVLLPESSMEREVRGDGVLNFDYNSVWKIFVKRLKWARETSLISGNFHVFEAAPKYRDQKQEGGEILSIITGCRLHQGALSVTRFGQNFATLAKILEYFLI